MITRISSAMNQLTLALSAVAEYPAVLSAAVHLALSQPSTLVGPTDMSTDFEPGTLTILNERPDLVRKSWARSHCVKLDHGPTKMWKLQVAWSADTVIGFFSAKVSSSGFT